MTANAYDRLHPLVQKWVYRQGWHDLRPVQKQAVDAIMSGDKDVVISASTAAGKTEAFFLPALSSIKHQNLTDGFGIVYISPLKALINDQYRRLESLCELLDMPVTPWHGDSSQGKKRKIKQNPQGVLLITPESLESILIRESGWFKRACHNLQFIVIDEFHAFIGNERGHHLLSLINRLEALVCHSVSERDCGIPRIALSATLGDIDTVPRLLRASGEMPCVVIEDSNGEARLKMQVRGYEQRQNQEQSQEQISAEEQVCQDLYRFCRGSSNLIFANSRKRTESIAVRLSDSCNQQVVPNEFFPHHGSLSKEIRESLEARLQKETLPTTAVCTMTLELGIDIGKVQSVAQVTAPHSVSSLRQRLGRSGRRGEPAILRMLITENQLTKSSSLVDKLRLELLQSLAMIRLLLANKWFEPPDTSVFHFSTLLHQVLALIAQWGGVRADQAFQLLCKTGPFNKVTIAQYKQLLIHMGQEQLINQLSSGELVLGVEGERLVDHYSFYAVFQTPEEYRIVANGKTLGSLPIESPLLTGQHIVFAGRRWQVKEIDAQKKCIYVEATRGGQPPSFGGEGMSIHDRVRQEMFEIVKAGDYRISRGQNKVDFADQKARTLFEEGLHYFKDLALDEKWLVQQGDAVYLVPWLGDKKVNTLAMLLVISGFKASAFAGVIEIRQAQVSEIEACLKALCDKEAPTNVQLAELVKDKCRDKYDEYLPEALLTEGYAARMFDAGGLFEWLQKEQQLIKM